MSDDLPEGINELSVAAIEEILCSLADGYSRKLNDDELSEEVSRLLTVFCLDLVNLLHLIRGNPEAVIENQEKYGMISAIQLQPMAAYQEKVAEQEAEVLAEDPDPLKWN